MFRAEPWARAFMNGLETTDHTEVHGREKTAVNPEDALGAFRAYCLAGLSVPGELSGFADAKRFEAYIDDARNKCGDSAAALYAEKFFLLMVKKGHFHQYKKIAREIEILINEKNGIAEADMEAPFDCAGKDGEDFLGEVESILKKKIGAKKVAVRTRLVPDLIAGVRIRVGGRIFDGSLKTRLQRMTEELS
jgi:ATP synthase F1 delta subunit